MHRRSHLEVSWTAGCVLALALGLFAGPAATAQGFGKNKIQYRDFQWRIYHSPHFDVYYYTDEEALLQKVVSFAESAYDHLSREFDFQITEPTPLIFYTTHSAFEQNNIILNFIPEGVGAFATPVRNRMVLPVDLPDPELMALLLHELTHIFQYHILFQGNLGKGIVAGPPLWFMEGMASYMAKDETARDKMFLRDAVVNDRIPSVSQGAVGGFFAYRFGHAVFDFIEERWSKEGFRDFMFEVRSTLGARVDRAIKRTFRMEPEDFDSEFRRWLRRRYLPELVETGEPSDFGRPFRVEGSPGSQQISPVASPSGDLVAAFSSHRGDVDVVLFDAKNRHLLRNLTKGFTSRIQYLVAQELSLDRKLGRDLAFSPDGNTVAVFAKREGGRSLVFIDVLKGGIRRIVEMDIEQQLNPAWSPDGETIAFSGYQNGQFDIFLFHVETGSTTNLTQDEIYDGGPTFSPDGKSLVFSSVVGGYAKLFRIDLDNPSQRFPLTSGESNESDPVYSPTGKRIYFTSDRTGANNIFSLELETGAIRQHTNAVTGCFMPTVLPSPKGGERLVYTGFWRGRFDLYLLDIEDPITEPRTLEQIAEPATRPVSAEELPRYEPAIEVALDDSNKEDYRGFKFFLEDADSFIGVSDDQTFVGRAVVSFSDYLGDRRIFAAFSSIASFQNFDVFYLDLSRRLQWQIHLFDDRDFFIGVDQSRGRIVRGRALFRQTGAVATLIYPFNFNNRVEVGGGYIFRDLDAPFFFVNPETGEIVSIIEPRKDDFPVVRLSFVGDTAVFAPWGAVSGHRWRFDTDYAPDLDESGTLTSTIGVEYRKYIPVTRRSNFAFRVFGAASNGNIPNPIFFGGLDTVRGFDFRSLVGDRAFFANAEFRFPLIDILFTPVLRFEGIRGVIFFDVGGAWFTDRQGFRFFDEETTRLQDAVASYGFGVTIRLFGFDANWDFAKEWDLQTSAEGFETSFWIGARF